MNLMSPMANTFVGSPMAIVSVAPVLFTGRTPYFRATSPGTTLMTAGSISKCARSIEGTPNCCERVSVMSPSETAPTRTSASPILPPSSRWSLRAVSSCSCVISFCLRRRSPSFTAMGSKNGRGLARWCQRGRVKAQHCQCPREDDFVGNVVHRRDGASGIPIRSVARRIGRAKQRQRRCAERVGQVERSRVSRDEEASGREEARQPLEIEQWRDRGLWEERAEFLHSILVARSPGDDGMETSFAQESPGQGSEAILAPRLFVSR